MGKHAALVLKSHGREDILVSLNWPLYRVIGSEANHPDLVSPDIARKIYHDMVLLGTFDEKTINLQRQGRVGTFPPSLGQEAAEVGSAWALSPNDWLAPSYRDHGAIYVHGVSFRHVVLFAMGKGSSIDGQARVLPSSIPISSHLPHAVGLAMAAQALQEEAIAIAYFGDGGTSEGDFHEALNFAGVFRAPVVFFCQNNGWAISVPVSQQTATPTLVQKAEAYGIVGVRVDGNDALACYQVVAEARQRALSGEGPTLIEAVTYRIGPHTTADDPTRYRPADELAHWIGEEDPLTRLRKYLEAKGTLAVGESEKIVHDAQVFVNQMVQEALDAPAVEIETMFDYVYETLPVSLRMQRDAAIETKDGGLDG
jgi:pyruvate dehydrogenase E1 component alpha subunit